MKQIIVNLQRIHQRMADACLKSERAPDSVRLLCVSKTKPVEMICAAYEAGERHFGESYALEAVAKIEQIKALGMTDIVWHFIGPIQSNKTKHIAMHFDVVESVDRIKILERLNEQRPDGMTPLAVMLQVNISKEEQKQGCAAEQLGDLLAAASLLPKLQVIGLMGVAKINASDMELRASFSLLQRLRDQYQQQYPSLVELSMGMTDDMEQAITCGTTEVRIGSAIFGAREYPIKA